MPHRVINWAIVERQNMVRKKLLDMMSTFNGNNGENMLQQETEVVSALKKTVEDVRGDIDLPFFQSYQNLAVGLFQLLHFAYKEFKGNADAQNHLKAAKANFSVLGFDSIESMQDFNQDIEPLIAELRDIQSFQNCLNAFQHFCRIRFPIVLYTEYDPFAQNERSAPSEDENLDRPFVPILSVFLVTDGEPWANPQIVKPKVSYKISGKVLINEWPAGYEKIVFTPVTTLPSNSFEMNLETIRHSNNIEFLFEGHVTFLIPQHSVNDTTAIRIIGHYEGNGLPKLFCTIIGYDQLLVKVLDPNSTNYPTGFKMMDQTVNEINYELITKYPAIDAEDRHNFLVLLAGILNYQGYCLQQGIYGGVTDVNENQFRDALIQHLTAQPNIGGKIVKESHIGGGRVEISFNGIVAELKVERKISDRAKMLEKYGNQPVAYSSASSQMLSILCILDLSEKKFPIAVGRNNVTLHKRPVHGFNSGAEPFPSKLGFIVIDGNTPKPSSYSK